MRIWDEMYEMTYSMFMTLLHCIKQLESKPLFFDNTEKRSGTKTIVQIVKEVLPQQISSFICFKPELERPNMWMIKGGEDVTDFGETLLIISQINEIASFEIDLYEHESFVVFTQN